MKVLFFSLFCIILCFSCKQKEHNIATIKTNYGDIKIRLYNDTPLHRDNFLKLASDGYYDGLLFHRVIKNFVIQAGDPDSKNARSGLMLGNNEIGYKIAPEIRPAHFHRKGVLAAAREGDNINPERNSSGSHFYIVQGQTFTPGGLDSAVFQINEKRHTAVFNQLKAKREAEIQKAQIANDFDLLIKINNELSEETRQEYEKEKLVLTQEQKKAYTTVGGIPHLDGAYTVFGEVIEGIEVVDKIASLETDINNRPLKNVVILKIEY